MLDWYSSRFAHFFFFFNDTATTEIYTLSLHDALPISAPQQLQDGDPCPRVTRGWRRGRSGAPALRRSEEHTSELQSRRDLVCRLLLEKKKKSKIHIISQKKKKKKKKKNKKNSNK